jgi:putative transcriptional regulator
MFESLRGQFLIAGKGLRDPNFYKTVVLLLEHGPGGALGLVVNRPTAVKVSTALGGKVELPEQHDRLYVGGPVQSSALFIMHNAPKLEASSHEVAPGLFVATSPEALEEVVRTASGAGASGQTCGSALKFRLFSGCAGWGPGQLEGELGRADWHLRPGDAELLFDGDAHNLWETLLRHAYDAQRLIVAAKGDPMCN